jgi:hypothetical protein
LQASSVLLDSGLPTTQEWFYPLGGKVQCVRQAQASIPEVLCEDCHSAIKSQIGGVRLSPPQLRLSGFQSMEKRTAWIGNGIPRLRLRSMADTTWILLLQRFADNTSGM